MWGLLIRGGLILAVLAGAYWLWDTDREAYALRKVNELAVKVKAEADRDWEKKLTIALQRSNAMTAAADAAAADLHQLRGQLDEKDRIIAAGRSELVRVRATASTVARRSEIHSNPGSACYAQELRSERLAAQVANLQISGITLADSNIELRSSLVECDAGAAEDAVRLRWWARVERAMRAGEEPPGRPD